MLRGRSKTVIILILNHVLTNMINVQSKGNQKTSGEVMSIVQRRVKFQSPFLLCQCAKSNLNSNFDQ